MDAQTPTQQLVTAPVRLTDGRQVGTILGVVTKFTGERTLTIEWLDDQMRELAKSARLVERKDGIYFVGQPSLGALVLRHGVVILS